jgi:hypothetical protein
MRKTVGLTRLPFMYSGTTFTNKSGAILGAHQKIDRVAYKYLSMITPSMDEFPDRKHILHFEGKNGPDGIKSKSPAKDEPWHFYDPFDEEDMQLLETIQDHYNELVKQLKKGSSERAAFDAAWLAHAIVDGLTPAHHFPYEENRDSIKNKIFIQGDTKLESFKKSWALWGTGGLISMHFLFETGVAFIIAPLSMKKARITDSDLETLVDIGYLEWFKRSAREIAILNMYDRFQSNGWTPKLVRDVRNELAPVIIKTVTLVWYSAMRDAGLLRTKK